MLPVCDFSLQGIVTVTYYTLGCSSVMVASLVLRFEVVHESVVNKWEEIFYFRLQRVT